MRNRSSLRLAVLLLFAGLPVLALDPKVVAEKAAAGLEFAEAPATQPRVVGNLREKVAGGDLEAMARTVVAGRSAALGLTAESALELHAIRHGKAVDVVRFRQTVAGVPVLRGAIAVSFNRRGEAIFIANDLKPVLGDAAAAVASAASPGVDEAAARATARAWLGIAGTIRHETSERAIFPGADGARAVWALRVEPTGEPHGDWEVLVDAATGAVLRIEDRALYGDTGQGQAYLPDPLATSGAIYGDPGYVDGSDADTPQLIAEIFDVALLELTFTGGVWTLVGPYADCRGELEDPATACVTDADGDFRFVPATRLSQAFEEIQDYYFIDTFMRYLNVDLGVPVVPFQYVGGVRYDSHGLSGADNSHYSGGSGIIAFGDGGVDDSEDPDVVIHELGHGIHDWVTNGNLSQQQGLSEGVGDYLAASYSRRAFTGIWTSADVEWNWVFKWDGHNPFWGGRLLNWNDNHLYTTGLGGLHQTGQFWSSCNLDIAEVIGYEEMDEAMLEGLSMTGGSTNQADAAQAVIDAATALGYDSATLTTMAAFYNDASGGFGCNYAVESLIFSDGFASGDSSAWDATVIEP